VDPSGVWYKEKYSRKERGMDSVEKAKVRLEHWISHNEHHNEDYEGFAKELEQAGKKESAGYIREMMQLSSRSTECLKKALKALGR
jgi:predicted patatin/cPLA2 family phospholipase